ncbi:hypothetical protein FOL47_000040 [Perkinsus chesapeaki]|uniref:Plus3 domain-containing protein n=1 Tax=Perkinsus chesapeaki TaxID=330153 RepID=A0A7J6N5W9_PERCH|nr:hypothetical protein FOL47_000040 [Perkinsus chesapeaki]
MAPKRKSAASRGGGGRNKKAKGGSSGAAATSVVLPELEAPLFGDDLMIDDADRQKLKEMTEVEREAVFNERYEQLVRYRERKKALERLKAKGVTPLPAARSPKKAKVGEVSDAESDSDESSSGESESGSSSSDDEDESSGSSESESSSDEEESDEEEEDEKDGKEAKESRKPEKAQVDKPKHEELTLQMARKMLVTRQLCFEYVQLPEKLRDSVLTGSFCRLQTTFQNTSGSGQMDTTADGGDGYMMAEITGLKPLEKPTQVRIPTTNGAIKVMTLHHNLAIRLLSGVAAVVPVTCLSNQPISEVELQLWAAAVGPDHTQEVALNAPKKIKELQEARRFEWTSENIDKYLAKKHGGQSVVSTSLAMEESQLVTKIEALMQKMQDSELSQIDRSEIEIQLNKEEMRLKEVTQEIKASQQKFQAENQRLRRLQEINRRNLELQQQTDLEMAKRRARQLGSTTSKGVTNGVNGPSLNPFERRECRPTMLWDVGGHRDGATGDAEAAKAGSPKKLRQEERSKTSEEKKVKTKSRFERMLEVYRSVDPLNSVIKVQSLLSKLENEGSGPHLLDEVRHARAMGPADPSKPAPVPVLGLWSQQLPSAAGRQGRGEVMTFKEWQQRVEEQAQQG